MLRLVTQLHALRRALKAQGKDALAAWTILGSGVFRTAYTDGVFVVKLSVAEQYGYDKLHSVYKKERLQDCLEFRRQFRYAPSIHVTDAFGNRWEIQLQYKRFLGGNSPDGMEATDEDYRIVGRFRGDLHFGNVGKDHRGRIVAFDY